MIHRNWKLLKRFSSPQNADPGEKLFTKYRKLVRLNTNQLVCQMTMFETRLDVTNYSGEAPASAAVWVQHNKANTRGVGVKEVAKDLSGIAPVIPIDRLDTLPLYCQICEGFRAAILRGNLQPGQQVPSSRHLAEDLEVSRFPVLDAYAQLLSEGYFESRVGSGTFVSASLPDQLPHGRKGHLTKRKFMYAKASSSLSVVGRLGAMD